MTGFLRGSRFERTSTGIRIVRRGSSDPETVDATTAYHALARGSADLEDPADIRAIQELERVGQELLARTARELARDGLLISE